MSKSFKNILFIISFVILLPLSLYTVMEISSLNENERMLESIYIEQLDATLFSVNQFSNDLISGLTNKIENLYNKTNGEEIVSEQFLQENLAMDALILWRNEALFNAYSHPNIKSATLMNKSDSLFSSNQELIKRLIRYKEAKYLKLEPIGKVYIDGQPKNVLLFILANDVPALLYFNAVVFVEDLLAPRFQQIATERLILRVNDVESTSTIYATENLNKPSIQSKALWLIPEFELEVALRGESIKEIIEYRTQQNVISIVLLSTLIVFGVALVFRNIRKEMLLNKAKSDFVANVSHEIRTPLSLINMFTETLLMDRVPTEKKKKEYYEIINKETTRLKNIVNKILNFSQIEADKKTFHFSDANPDEIVSEVINSYSYHLKNKGFTYSFSLNQESVELSIDQEAFAEALINLLDNAMKYSGDVKDIHVKTYVQNSNYIIEVTDKGKGIDPKLQQQVFEKFYRVTTGDLYDKKGTGLGLALVKNIMEAHGGKVELKSAPGKGSTFSLWYPINENKNA